MAPHHGLQDHYRRKGIFISCLTKGSHHENNKIQLSGLSDVPDAGAVIPELPGAGGGVFIGTTFMLSSNAFGFKQQDIRNPQFGVVGETGIQYMNFLVLVDYNYSLTKFFAKGVNEYGANVRSYLQVFSLKVGLQF